MGYLFENELSKAYINEDIDSYIAALTTDALWTNLGWRKVDDPKAELLTTYADVNMEGSEGVLKVEYTGATQVLRFVGIETYLQQKRIKIDMDATNIEYVALTAIMGCSRHHPAFIAAVGLSAPIEKKEMFRDADTVPAYPSIVRMAAGMGQELMVRERGPTIYGLRVTDYDDANNCWVLTQAQQGSECTLEQKSAGWVEVPTQIGPVAIAKWLQEVEGYKPVMKRLKRRGVAYSKLMKDDPSNYKLFYTQPSASTRLPLTVKERSKLGHGGFESKRFTFDAYVNPRLQMAMPDIRLDGAYTEWNDEHPENSLYAEERGERDVFFVGAMQAVYDWAYQRACPFINKEGQPQPHKCPFGGLLISSQVCTTIDEVLKHTQFALMLSAPALIAEYDVLKSMLYETDPAKMRREGAKYRGPPGDLVSM